MNKSKWIAIEDRLPEVDVSVLVCGRARWADGGPVVSVASLEWKKGWGDAEWGTRWCSVGCEWDMDTITHWQPLPDLPGE